MDTVIKDDKTCHTNCFLSWSAIIAGALVAFSLSALCNLLNAGLGLVAFPESFRGMVGLGAAGYVWLIICGIIAMFIAGWVAGRIVKGRVAACFGLLHGFLAWSLALFITLYVAGHFVSNAAHAGISVDNRAEAARIIDQDMPRNDLTREDVANAAGTMSLGIFFIFLVGAMSAAVGGYVGAKNNITKF